MSIYRGERERAPLWLCLSDGNLVSEKKEMVDLQENTFL
jgi:hypothetical protein